MLGLYLQMGSGWWRVLQRIGSVLFFVSPVLLTLAFGTNPAPIFIRICGGVRLAYLPCLADACSTSQVRRGVRRAESRRQRGIEYFCTIPPVAHGYLVCPCPNL